MRRGEVQNFDACVILKFIGSANGQGSCDVVVLVFRILYVSFVSPVRESLAIRSEALLKAETSPLAKEAEF